MKIKHWQCLNLKMLEKHSMMLMKIFLTFEIVAIFVAVSACAWDYSYWENVQYSGFTVYYTISKRIRKIRNIALVLSVLLSLTGFLFAIWSA